MTALRSMLAWDVRLQSRYGFYAVYAVLTVAFVVGLRALDPALRTDATVLLVVVDPTVLGFYFVAGMVLFEKSEGVLDALVVSPLGDRGYLASKALTLAALATVAGTLVAALGHGITARLPVLVAGIFLGATFFVLVGFVAVARYDSVNEYFISAVGWGTVLFLPLFGYVGVVDTPLFYLLPAQPVLVLVEGGLRPVPAWELAYAVAYLLAGNAVAFAWARRTFREHVVRGGDPGEQLGRQTTPDVRRDVPSARHRSGRARSPIAAMVVADLKNWTRDPMLAFAALGPLLLAVVVRYGAPLATDLAAPTVDLAQYYPVVAGTMVVFAPMIYGFVVGMFVLEDRELGVLTAYRTTPLTGRGYLAYRAITATVLTVAASLPALALVDLAPVPPLALVATAAVGALGAPLIAIAFGTLATNTIEGLAISKLLNLVAFAPAIVIATVPEPLQFLAGILPPYWPLKAYVTATSTADPTAWLPALAAGVVAHALAVIGLARRFSNQAT